MNSLIAVIIIASLIFILGYFAYNLVGNKILGKMGKIGVDDIEDHP